MGEINNQMLVVFWNDIPIITGMHWLKWNTNFRMNTQDSVPKRAIKLNFLWLLNGIFLNHSILEKIKSLIKDFDFNE